MKIHPTQRTEVSVRTNEPKLGVTPSNKRTQQRRWELERTNPRVLAGIAFARRVARPANDASPDFSEAWPAAAIGRAGSEVIEKKGNIDLKKTDWRWAGFVELAFCWAPSAEADVSKGRQLLPM
jgi:hypothetical protein